MSLNQSYLILVKELNPMVKNSPEPNDGEYSDTFSSEGTVRYGEETDVDDI